MYPHTINIQFTKDMMQNRHVRTTHGNEPVVILTGGKVLGIVAPAPQLRPGRQGDTLIVAVPAEPRLSHGNKDAEASRRRGDRGGKGGSLQERIILLMSSERGGSCPDSTDPPFGACKCRWSPRYRQFVLNRLSHLYYN